MTEVIKSGAVKQQTNLLFLKSWQPRELTITSESLTISKPGASKPSKVLSTKSTSIQVRGSDLVLTIDGGGKVTIRCKNVPEAKSWSAAAERVKEGKVIVTPKDAPVTTSAAKGMKKVLTTDQITSGSEIVSYNKAADSAVVELFDEETAPNQRVASTMINGGYSFGVQINGGFFTLPVEKQLVQRRATYGSSQALMVLWRDARLMKEKGKIGEAVRLLRQHVDLAKMVFGPTSGKVVESLQLLASTLSEEGSHDLAQKLLEEAAAIEVTDA